MIKRLTLAAGIGIGYVLGARAGRKQYDQLASKAQDVWHDPRVQRTVGSAADAVKDHAPGVASQVGSKAKDLSGKAADKARERGQHGVADKIDSAGSKAEKSTHDAGKAASDAAANNKPSSSDDSQGSAGASS